jgi:hypothetical protein
MQTNITTPDHDHLYDVIAQLCKPMLAVPIS